MKNTQKLLSISADAKTKKGEAKGYLSAILYLAPEKTSGVANLCPESSAGCRAACLFTAGRAGIPSKNGSFMVQEARIKKTKFFKSNRIEFMAQLFKEIEAFIKKAEKKDLIPVVRMNGTSDLSFENPLFGIMQAFPDLIFYDYTKVFKRAEKWALGKMPANYHLTFSRNEENHENVKRIAELGGNIAVVFSDTNYPKTYLGLEVINGDESDLRFLDGKAKCIALKAKGKAKKDTSGFVVDTKSLS